MCKELEDWLQEEKSAGEALGEERGLAKGENRLAKLMTELMAAHRSQDINLALNDAAARQKLYQEFHIE